MITNLHGGGFFRLGEAVSGVICLRKIIRGSTRPANSSGRFLKFITQIGGLTVLKEV